MNQTGKADVSRKRAVVAVFCAVLFAACGGTEKTVPDGPPESVRLWVGGEVHLGGSGTDRLDLLSDHLNYGRGVVNLVGPLHVDADDDRASITRDDGKVLLQNGPRIPKALTSAGVRVVGVANDHALDLGSDSAGRTMTILKMRGLETAGGPAGPAKITQGGVRIAITQHHLPLGELSPDVPEALAAAANDSDLHVATFHVADWADGAPTPPVLQAAVQAAISAGANVIAAHGGQNVGPVERRDNVPIAWNLGPLATDRPLDKPADSAILLIHRLPEGEIETSLLFLHAGMAGDYVHVHGEPETIVSRLNEAGSTLAATSEAAVYSF